MSTTRYPGGVTNVKSTNALGNMGQLDPSKYITWFDDYVSTGTVDGAGGLTTAATTVVLGPPKKSFVGNLLKGMWAKASFSLATVAANSATLGFADVLSAPTKGVYVTLSGGNLLTLTIKGVGTSTATIPVAYANAQMVTLGLAYVPNSHAVYAFFNGKAILAIHDVTNFDQVTNLLGGLVPTGATATVDYLFLAQER